MEVAADPSRGTARRAGRRWGSASVRTTFLPDELGNDVPGEVVALVERHFEGRDRIRIRLDIPTYTVGVDPSSAQIERNQSLDEAIVGDIAQVPLGPDGFDLI